MLSCRDEARYCLLVKPITGEDKKENCCEQLQHEPAACSRFRGRHDRLRLGRGPELGRPRPGPRSDRQRDRSPDLINSTHKHTRGKIMEIKNLPALDLEAGLP